MTISYDKAKQKAIKFSLYEENQFFYTNQRIFIV